MEFLMFVVLIVTLNNAVSTMDIPTFITPCHRNDKHFDECCLKEGQHAIPFIAKGDNDYGYPKLNPLVIKKLDGINYEGITINLTDVEIDGFQNTVIRYMKFDLDKMEFRMNCTIEKVTFHATYYVSGKLFLIELNHSGIIEITLEHAYSPVFVPYDLFTVNGVEHAKFNSSTIMLDFSVKNLRVKFNVFGRENEIITTLNRIINDNWGIFFDDMKQTIVEIIKSFITSIMNPLCKNVPYNIFFPE